MTTSSSERARRAPLSRGAAEALVAELVGEMIRRWREGEHLLPEDFLERHPEDGLEAYQEAIKLDSGYRGDAALLRNVRGLLDDRRLAPEALDLLIKGVGKPAAPALAEVASTDKRIELRRAARKACAELGCLNQVDQVSSYLLDLQQDKTCEERRVAVIALHKLGDRRALDPLRKVRRRRGGLFVLFTGANECMKKELDDAIKSLEGE